MYSELEFSERSGSLLESCESELERVVARKFLGAGIHLERGPRTLVGRPDFRVSATNILIFAHGCYWHRHRCSAGSRTPKSDVLYWTGRFARQVERDSFVLAQLRCGGWEVCVVWECEVDALDPKRVMDSRSASVSVALANTGNRHAYANQ